MSSQTEEAIDRRSFLATGIVAATGVVASQLIPVSLAAADEPKGQRTFSDYKYIALSRSSDGVVTMRLHSDQKEFVLTLEGYTELARAFREVSEDFGNKVLLLTGTGTAFIKGVDFSTFGDLSKTAGWLNVAAHAQRMLQACIDVEIPVVSAINGPIPLRSEMALIADYVISDEKAWFQDPHLANGVTPGDGIFAVWSELLGINRARALLLTGGKLSAKEAHSLGVVAELHGGNKVLARAMEVASDLAKKPSVALRNTRQVMTRKLSRAIAEGMSQGWPLEILSGVDKK